MRAEKNENFVFGKQEWGPFPRYVNKGSKGLREEKQMKKIGILLLVLAMVCICANALGELGFAEIKKDNVNVRESAGGKQLWQLDAPQSVYVFEEKTVGKYLWCHVSTYIG